MLVERDSTHKDCTGLYHGRQGLQSLPSRALELQNLSRVSLEEWPLIRQEVDLGRVRRAIQKDGKKKITNIVGWEELTLHTMLDTVVLLKEYLARKGISIEDYQ